MRNITTLNLDVVRAPCYPDTPLAIATYDHGENAPRRASPRIAYLGMRGPVRDQDSDLAVLVYSGLAFDDVVLGAVPADDNAIALVLAEAAENCA